MLRNRYFSGSILRLVELDFILMPKVKTKKAAVKRFRVTKNAIVLRGRQMGSHLKLAKSASQKRRQKSTGKLENEDARRIKRLTLN